MSERAASPEPGAVVLEIGGQRFETGSPGLAEAVARAHARMHRPRCLCRPDGVEMYVARQGDGYVVKRMPDSGSRHRPDCPSYAPPAELSGLAPLLGHAITENPLTGETVLKLDFALAKQAHRPSNPQQHAIDADTGSAHGHGARLSLRGLLHHLWDQAGLTRWHPGFAGKRSWVAVRRHLLQAAGHNIVCGAPLLARLYLPEPFYVEQRDAISARTSALWARMASSPYGGSRQLMLLVAELRELAPARHGFRAVVKHMPDQAFLLDEQLYQSLERKFEAQLALWSACNDMRMLVIATFGVGSSGSPTISDISLVPATREWLPVDSILEKQLIDHLVREERSFVKCLRYNLGRVVELPSAALTDCHDLTPELYIALGLAEPQRADETSSDAVSGTPSATSSSIWRWYPSEGSIPALPAKWQPDCQPSRSSSAQARRCR